MSKESGYSVISKVSYQIEFKKAPSQYECVQLSLETLLNPLLPKSDLYILLCLMPDDFTRQRETL